MKSFVFITLFAVIGWFSVDFLTYDLDARPGGGSSYRSSSSSSSSRSSSSSGGSGGGGGGSGDLWTVGLVIFSILGFGMYKGATDFSPTQKLPFLTRFFLFSGSSFLIMLAGLCVRNSMLATSILGMFIIFCPFYIIYQSFKLLSSSRETIYVAKAGDKK